MFIQNLVHRINAYDLTIPESKSGMVMHLTTIVWPIPRYIDEIKILTRSDTLPTLSHQQLKYLHMYVVQNIILAHYNVNELDPATLLIDSLNDMQSMMTEHRSILDTETGYNLIEGESTTQAGSKTEYAKIIFHKHFNRDEPDNKINAKLIKELFQSELDMGKSGAMTYYYKLKRELK